MNDRQCRVSPIITGVLALTLFCVGCDKEPTGPAPFAGSVTRLGCESVRISWEKSVDQSGGSVSYRVYLGASCLAENVSDLTYEATGLSPDTAYTITVRAINDSNDRQDLLIPFVTLPPSYGEVLNKTMTSGKLRREYSVYLPSGIGDADEIPLVIDFHGSGGIAKNEISSGYGLYIAQREKFLYVKPQALPYHIPSEPNAEWNVELHGRPWDDLLFTESIVDGCLDEYPIDRHRVYLMGMSSGGFMAYYAGVRLAGRLAAIAPMAGYLYPEVLSLYPLERPLPLLVIHGTADTLVPYYADLSVVKLWVKQNGCTRQTETQLPDLDPHDGSTVTLFPYGGSTPASDILLYRVNGGYHGVPGIEAGQNQDINAYEEIWKFFTAHALPE